MASARLVGATSDEIQASSVGDNHQSVSPRTSELRIWGYLTYLLDADGNRVRRDTRLGNPAYVLVVTLKGVLAVERNEPIYKPGAEDITSNYHGGKPTSDAAFRKRERGTDRLRVLKAFIAVSPQIKSIFD